MKASSLSFQAAIVLVVVGMAWGLHMGISRDHAAMPAHAHLNLLGWVTMAIYGTFYALTHASLKPKLAWINFWLAGLGVVLMIPSLALYLPAHDTKFVPGILAGEAATIASLIAFAISVYRELVRPRLA